MPRGGARAAAWHLTVWHNLGLGIYHELHTPLGIFDFPFDLIQKNRRLRVRSFQGVGAVVSHGLAAGYQNPYGHTVSLDSRLGPIRQL